MSLSSCLAALSAFDVDLCEGSFALDMSEGEDRKAELAAIAADSTNTEEERAAARAILAGWNDEDFMTS